MIQQTANSTMNFSDFHMNVRRPRIAGPSPGACEVVDLLRLAQRRGPHPPHRGALSQVTWPQSWLHHVTSALILLWPCYLLGL
jgi:hypothetical protein